MVISPPFLHTGVHLWAPADRWGPLPVRAMADGEVVLLSPPTPQSRDPAHPQNYGPGVDDNWLDNGCVILRHDTEIGASALQLQRRIRDPNPKAEGRETQAHLNDRLGDETVKKKLLRSVCYFPTEWDRETVDQRHAWMKVRQNGTVVSDKVWTAFQAHNHATSFEHLPQGYLNAKWRFHPVEFVEVMRKVGWLSNA